MNQIESIFKKFQIDFTHYNRITEESFASEVYLVDMDEGQRILKLAHSETKYWRELRGLEFVSGHLSVPQVQKALAPEPGFNGALLMKKLDGHPLNLARLDPVIAKVCGHMLAKLHSIPVEGLGYFQKDGFEKVPFENWWSFRQDLVFGSWTKAIEKRMDPNVLKRIHNVFALYFENLKESQICFTHHDFRFGNILAENGNVSGVIDFESSRTGDPAYDFIKIHEAIGDHPELWESFLAGYSELRSLPDLNKTIPYYQLDLNYGFLQWAVLRGDENLFQERLTKLLELIEKE
jgi:aminoglycoside phosphotransferase (APT) family kinase protein